MADETEAARRSGRRAPQVAPGPDQRPARGDKPGATTRAAALGPGQPSLGPEPSTTARATLGQLAIDLAALAAAIEDGSPGAAIAARIDTHWSRLEAALALVEVEAAGGDELVDLRARQMDLSRRLPALLAASASLAGKDGRATGDLADRISDVSTAGSSPPRPEAVEGSGEGGQPAELTLRAFGADGNLLDLLHGPGTWTGPLPASLIGRRGTGGWSWTGRGGPTAGNPPVFVDGGRRHAAGWAPDGTTTLEVVARARGAAGAVGPLAFAAGTEPRGPVGATLQGPLPAGAIRHSGGLVVTQHAAGLVEFRLGSSIARIRAEDGAGYRFVVVPAATPDQRVVEVTAGPRVVVERAIDPASPIDLVVHERAVSAEEAAATSSAGTTDANVRLPDLVLPEVSASGDHDAVSLHFGDSRVHIAGGPDRRFAYWVDPRWSGPDRTDRVVHIVATPGVRVDEWNLRPAAPFEHRTQPARRLVPLVLRVQDPGRVPPQGTAIDPAGYVDQVELTGATVTTGAAGVTVSDDYLGATLSLRAADPTRGARWAYQVEPTRRELRVLVGPGVVVDVREVNRPMPGDRDDPYSDFGLRVLVYQAHDERTIPAQGTPLPRPVLEALGRPRQPDVHRFPAPSRGELALRAGLGATRTGVDFGVGFVPGLGELTDAAEAATGVNKWGERLSAGERVLTAVAAALPFVAGATMVRASRAARAADAARDAGATLRELAELVGRSHDEVEAIVHGVHRLDPDDQVAVRRVLAAFQGGGPFNPEDLVRVRSARLLSGDAPAGLSASAAPFDGPGRAWHVPADDLGPVLGRSRRHGGEVERASAGADAAARADGRRYQIQHGRGDQTELHEQVAPVRGLADDAALPALLDDLMQASPHGADQAAAEAALIGHARDRGYLVQGSIEPRRLAEVEAALGADRAQVLLVMLSRGQRAVPGTSAHLVDQLARARALPEQHAHVQGSVPLADVLARLAETDTLSAEQRAAQIGVLEAMVKSARASKKPVVLHDASPALGGRTRADGTVATPGTTRVSGDGADSAPLGILDEMLAWKRSRQAGEQQKEQFGDLIKQYQHAVTMHKPAHARYDELVVTGDEFFTRYSMITEHGLAPAEVAARRASASQLGMQELRYSAEAGDLATIRADAAAVVRDRPPGVDVSLTMATTKNRTAAESPARNEQASMRRFVDAWHDEPDLQAAFSGLDSAGVEHAARTPATLWAAAAVRALRNAASLQDGLRGLRPEQLHGLAERLARIRGVDPRAARGVLDRLLLTPVDAALAEVDQVASVARATDDALRAQRAAERARLIRAGRDAEAADLLVERKLPWRPFVPGLSPAGAGRPALTFATVSVEELSHDARSVSEALALLRAETGQAVPAPAQLGLTVHAGEQLRNPGIDAFGLLDQVDHTLALGADRIGHGVILAVDPAVLIAEGLLPAGRAHEFAARQRALVAQVRARGITVEANLSSNAEISNLTQHQHPALRLLDDNLRVSVSTDDETVLAVTVQTELERFARTPGASRAEVAAVVLEGFRSRMGHRRLAGAAHLHQALRSSLLAGLTRLERAHLVDSLATRFHVAASSNVDQTLDRLLTTILGG